MLDCINFWCHVIILTILRSNYIFLQYWWDKDGEDFKITFLQLWSITFAGLITFIRQYLFDNICSSMFVWQHLLVRKYLFDNIRLITFVRQHSVVSPLNGCGARKLCSTSFCSTSFDRQCLLDIFGRLSVEQYWNKRHYDNMAHLKRHLIIFGCKNGDSKMARFVC